MDIGFLEFLLVMIVGLLVLGPDRMPEVARKGIYWWGRAKRTINDTREEIEREIGADDIRRQLHNENIMKSLGESKAAIEATVKETTDNIQRFKTIGEQKPRRGSAAAEPAVSGDNTQADELAVIKAKKELAAIRQAEAELAKQMSITSNAAEDTFDEVQSKLSESNAELASNTSAETPKPGNKDQL
ncbi:Sec-independent protein translocase protein TatB [Umboniibacter marinipuniceus]|uniref:Tat protein translocase TatB subunit n=1 Tax=Umboniibacter marinipuniceus TaxID=569599 RepID=A0A3M0AB00_9GAMM|nr:Sec-independent protein translocase protein TatB [Umboniibacter marinipuniceus]RMA82343.1 Tat protein translocase TatB subunit [Umboniibacter marinipuniceus]